MYLLILVYWHIVFFYCDILWYYHILIFWYIYIYINMIYRSHTEVLIIYTCAGTFADLTRQVLARWCLVQRIRNCICWCPAVSCCWRQRWGWTPNAMEFPSIRNQWLTWLTWLKPNQWWKLLCQVRISRLDFLWFCVSYSFLSFPPSAFPPFSSLLLSFPFSSPPVLFAAVGSECVTPDSPTLSLQVRGQRVSHLVSPPIPRTACHITCNKTCSNNPDISTMFHNICQNVRR